MQRELGANLKDYSFPGPFLNPFLSEPIVAVHLPWQIVTPVVRRRSIGVTCCSGHGRPRGRPASASRTGRIGARRPSGVLAVCGVGAAASAEYSSMAAAASKMRT
ncbi:unnamed protein product [Prorocentrum cordatum]|uniref:Uncharacterized protein n=1 Tax=Prorocentrum cordatum TaxID=2364126 RepID=A0ABN9QY63_9DINO|nr:unnamed protein product [Polarella glacialis]